MAAAGSRSNPEMREGTYAGWWASVLIIVLVLAVGGGLWFYYHPL